MIGQSIAHFEITAKIGEGGMGEVYQATDTRLNRQVALKILPQVFAQDKQRMSRFAREAQVLASLNHPHIAGIYGLEEDKGTRALVMELVEGEDLAERISRGPMPLEEALPIALQIAEALEDAHEKGIIHRDLKPANIRITPEGKVKVLDFGLAKALEEKRTQEQISNSPTLSMAATQAGVILGTASYMSPEQARGKAVDRRSDHWSFGAVLYEMLTGTKAFGGKDFTEILASVVKVDVDWSRFSGDTPQFLIRWLKRCLQADPNKRLRHIADLRLAIEDYLNDRTSYSVPAPVLQSAPRRKAAIPWSITAATIGAVIVFWSLWQGMPPSDQSLVRFVHSLPPGQSLEDVDSFGSGVVLSPDGSQLVYAATDSDGSFQLYRRPIDQLESTPIPGTEDANNPFFSPDGQWVGFFAGGKLKKVSVEGGAPINICDAQSGYGASWGADETIIFSPTFTSGLFRVSANGGTPQVVTDPDPEQGELAHRWPEFVPDSKSVIFTISTGMSTDARRVAALSLTSGERSILVEDGTNARYVSAGYLVYLHAGSLLAAPFDVERLEVTGPAVRVLDGVRFSGDGGVQYSFSRNGTLVWVPAEGMIQPSSSNTSIRQVAERSLIWVDRKGGIEQLPLPSNDYWAPSFSPDGRRVAVTVGPDIFILDLDREALSRVTFQGKNHIPIWTPDGQNLTFSSARDGQSNLFLKAADGTGIAEQLFPSLQHQDPGSWDPDGKMLAYAESHPETDWDIWLLSLEGGRRSKPFLQTRFREYHPMISPDGRWLAYTSDESGRIEVYVRSFPDGRGKQLISTEGGEEPVWSRGGGELFYRNAEKLMTVAVKTGSTFKAERPRLLLEVDYASREMRGYGSPEYDVSPDGRFLMVKRDSSPLLTEINFVLNWFEELKSLVPTE